LQRRFCVTYILIFVILYNTKILRTKGLIIEYLYFVLPLLQMSSINHFI